MALVGDIIVQAREAFPDPPGLVAAPTGFTAVAANTAGATLPAGTYYIQLAYINNWGESLPSAEVSVVVGGANNSIVITPSILLPSFPAGAIGYKAYVGVSSGQENISYISYGYTGTSIIGTGAAKSTSVLLPPIYGQPTLRSSAWNPDTDGGFVSASTMYRWLNDGLQSMSRIAGGIPGMTAVQAIAGQAMYRIPGKWIRLTNGWFDGWPLTFGKRGDVFLHNLVSGITGILTLEEWTDSTIVQAWPQPNRTGAITFLSGAIGNLDNPIPVASVSGFLSMGIGIISGIPQFWNGGPVQSSGQNYNELFAYTGLDPNLNQLLGGIRGIGGTTPQLWLSGAAVYEANLRFAGFRQPNIFAIGQSQASLGIPLGWEVPLSNYLVAQYRRAEQQEQVAQAMEKAFREDVDILAKQARGRVGPIQIGSITREVYPGGYSGGILIR